MNEALTPSNREFCSRLSEFMDHFGLSSRETGRVLGISAATISRLTTHKMSEDRVDRIRVRSVPAFDRWLERNGHPAVAADYFDNKISVEEIQETMLADRCLLTPEAVRFFGLSFDPFDVDRIPLGDELYIDKDLAAVADRVVDAALYHRFVAVIGSVGSGKTTLKHHVADKLEGRAKLINPEFFSMGDVTVTAIANKILAEFGQKIPRNKEERVARIRELLIDMAQSGTPVSIVLDECHTLDDSVISSLKNFWELTNGRTGRLLGVILYGQPKFVESRLRGSTFREIRQRVQIIETPEYKKQAAGYLAHRLKFAGGAIDELFDKAAIDLIAKNASTPLALGNLANFALMEAFAEEEKKVTASLPWFKNLRNAASGVVGIRRVA